MMEQLTLDSVRIFELGSYISNFLIAHGLHGESDLVVYVNPTELRKIDEDLYYRNKQEADKFIPSDEDIIVKFNNLNIIFSLKEEEQEPTKKKKQP